jgi:peptide-methionine (S)-S-oxide reductase
VTLLEKFYPAEDYHQNYLALHPNEPYIVFNDLPKVEQLKKDFPSWYR